MNDGKGQKVRAKEREEGKSEGKRSERGNEAGRASLGGATVGSQTTAKRQAWGIHEVRCQSSMSGRREGGGGEGI
jgi:hypothetical protein